MMRFTIGGLTCGFKLAFLSLRLGDAPHVAIDVSDGEEQADFFALACKRARGRIFLTQDSSFAAPLEVLGVSHSHPLHPLAKSERTRWLHGRLAPESLILWLDAPAAQAAPTETLVSQRGLKVPVETFLKAAIGDDRLILGGGEEALEAPAPGACLLRPGWMPNKDFLDLLVREIAWRDHRLLGWRAAPLYMDRGGIMLVTGRQSPTIQLNDGEWRLYGDLQPHRSFRALFQWDKGKEGEFNDLRKILGELLTHAQPSVSLLHTKGLIPAAPGLVMLHGRRRMAVETTLRIDGSAVRAVYAGFADLQPPWPTRATSRILPATVEGWLEDGATISLAPAPEAGWRVVVGDPAAPEGALRAQPATPARFAKAQGGFYWRPQAQDLRHVHLASGDLPVSLGAPMTRDDELEETQVDLALSGDRLKFSAAENASALEMTQEKVQTTAETVAIAGAVKVSGVLDVSS